MQYRVKIVEVLGAAALFRDAVQSRLQFFRLLALGDVEESSEDRLPTFKLNAGCGKLNPQRLALFAHDLAFDGRSKSAAAQPFHGARPQLFPEIRVGQIERAHSKKLFAAIARNDLAGTVYVKEALAVVDVDGRSRGFGDGAEFAFALRQRALTLLSLRGFHR